MLLSNKGGIQENCFLLHREVYGEISFTQIVIYITTNNMGKLIQYIITNNEYIKLLKYLENLLFEKENCTFEFELIQANSVHDK